MLLSVTVVADDCVRSVNDHPPTERYRRHQQHSDNGLLIHFNQPRSLTSHPRRFNQLRVACYQLCTVTTSD